MSDQMVEKRKAARRSDETLVRFDGDNFSIYSRATNISDVGAFVATHYLLDPGTMIQLSVIDSSSGAEERMPARVVRAMSETNARGETTIGLGVEFVGSDVTTVQ
jgi:hypothetical protein